MLQGLSALCLEVLNSRTNGIARQDDLILGEEALHVGISDTDLVGPPCEELIRHPGVGVLLLDERGDTQALSGLERRGTGIASDTDDDLGLELSDDITSGDECTQEVTYDSHIAPQMLSVKTSDLQSSDGEARLGHTLHLHTPLGPDEEDIYLRIATAESFGDGDGGEDMTARSSTANDGSLYHSVSSCSSSLGSTASSSRGRSSTTASSTGASTRLGLSTRDAPIMIPKAMLVAMIEEPP